MLDKNEFKKIQKEIEEFDEKREQLIHTSRDIIQVSKKIIYAVHRDDLKNASNFIKDIEKKKTELKKIGTNLDTGIDRTAYQEYVEAICYYEFVKNKKIPSKASLGVSSEHYLLGLCDLTGELARKAVANIIQKKFKEALEIKELVSEIYREFLNFNLRNSELRRKSDQIKWNLKKLEDIIFDAKIKGMMK